MLVLERKEGQALQFEMPDGRKVNVTVLSIDGKAARIGIEAPKDIKVMRDNMKNLEVRKMPTGAK